MFKSIQLTKGGRVVDHPKIYTFILTNSFFHILSLLVDWLNTFLFHIVRLILIFRCGFRSYTIKFVQIFLSVQEFLFLLVHNKITSWLLCTISGNNNQSFSDNWIFGMLTLTPFYQIVTFSHAFLLLTPSDKKKKSRPLIHIQGTSALFLKNQLFQFRADNRSRTCRKKSYHPHIY